MGIMRTLKRWFEHARPRERPRRRRDPEYSSLPGGSSAKDAARASPGRAGELAD
jgi:hypothetical protein